MKNNVTFLKKGKNQIAVIQDKHLSGQGDLVNRHTFKSKDSGTINNDFEHFMHHVLDITKSLAYHGFKKIVLVNGHGSNMPNLDLVARRTNLETDAECVLAAWWNLLTVDKDFGYGYRYELIVEDAQVTVESAGAKAT